jgi:hypothetical protein
MAWITTRSGQVPVITRRDGTPDHTQYGSVRNGTPFTPTEAKDELGFFVVEVGFVALKHTAMAFEKALHVHLHRTTGDPGDLGHIHRRLGVQLMRANGAGNYDELPDVEGWIIFLAVSGPITEQHFDQPIGDPTRLLMGYNGVDVQIVKASGAKKRKRVEFEPVYVEEEEDEEEDERDEEEDEEVGPL